MQIALVKTWRVVALLIAASALGGCGYNSIQSKDEGVKAAWSEVVNQYQRRADLVPNLVKTVQGYAQHEEEIFIKVAEARASAGKITLSADDLSDEAKIMGAGPTREAPLSEAEPIQFSPRRSSSAGVNGSSTFTHSAIASLERSADNLGFRRYADPDCARQRSKLA